MAASPDPRIAAYREALAAAPEDMTALRALWAADDAAYEASERDECRTCGQQVLGERDASGAFRCFHCLETARAPQGEAMRLFEPVAAPMAGQQVIGP